jgi:GNAT superfamily N-acetyltransferase
LIQYRGFRNADPPALVEIWNACFVGRGAAQLRGTILLDYFTLSKPYFDAAGLIVALDEGRPVGFVHAGFGPDGNGTGVDPTVGIVCSIGVLPSHRGRGIGGELLRRSEEYLRGRGARRLIAGPMAPRNPYTFALYGGAASCGFLASDPMAQPFLRRFGYRPGPARLVMQRLLDSPIGVADARFPAHRQRYEIVGAPQRGLSWYEEASVGPVELQEYRLTERVTGRVAARATLWEMETFGQRWNQHPVGLVRVGVEPDQRRNGLAKFLLAQLLRYLQEQFFTLAEAHAPADDPAVTGLLRAFGFGQVDEGFAYERDAA